MRTESILCLAWVHRQLHTEAATASKACRSGALASVSCRNRPLLLHFQDSSSATCHGPRSISREETAAFMLSQVHKRCNKSWWYQVAHVWTGTYEVNYRYFLSQSWATSEADCRNWLWQKHVCETLRKRLWVCVVVCGILLQRVCEYLMNVATALPFKVVETKACPPWERRSRLQLHFERHTLIGSQLEDVKHNL